MNSSEKILKLISSFVETGILTSQDAKKELINNLKFKRDDLIDKLQLVSREEYEVLKKNSLNDNKWEIYPKCALGNFDGNININVSTYSPSSSILNFSKIHQEAKPEAKMVKKETCPIYKLDTVINELKLQNVNYCMKIDTQGYEKFIIEGAKEYLKNCKILYCEVSLKEVYNSAPLWFEIIDILKSQGFEIASIENGFTEKLNNNLLQADIIFVRND